MTKSAKPGSLRKYIKDSIRAIPGCEDIDHLMRREPEGKKADYLLYDRTVIIEQKEYANSPQHTEKGRRYQDYADGLFNKYGVDPDILNESNPNGKFQVLSAEEAARILKLKSDFYDKIKDEMHKANTQIRSTKKILGLPNAVGVILVIFDLVDSIIPAVIHQRVVKTFEISKNGVPLYEHIDIFIYALRLKHLRYNGFSRMNGYIQRDGSPQPLECAERILGDLRKGLRSNWIRKVPSRDDTVEQLTADVFDP